MWPCHWHEHVDAWGRNPYDAEILTLRYEDLLTSPARELRKICVFAGVSRSDEQIRKVVEMATMDRLRKKERREGSIPVPSFRGDKLFFRRGEAGSHLDEMSPLALAIFLHHSRPALERLGYLTEDRAYCRIKANDNPLHNCRPPHNGWAEP